MTVDIRSDRILARPDRYVGFAVCDPLEEQIGTVEELFAGASGEVRYIRVKMGFLGLKSVLLPVTNVRVNGEQRMLVIK